MGNVAPFEDLIPNYHNANNTNALNFDFQANTRPSAPKSRPCTSQLERMAPKYMVKNARD